MPSPLELLHPDGRVRRVLVLGRQEAGSRLVPGAVSESQNADLALIAPSRHELRQRGWLERAAYAAAGGLAEHGLVYALVPRRSRHAARSHLRRAGLVLEPAFAQLPGRGMPRYLLPLLHAPWRHALSELIGAHPRARRVLRAAGAFPRGGSILAFALPSVGIVARRPGAAPLTGWIEGLGGGTRPTAHAVVATSWRASGGPVVLHCFAAGEPDPWGVAKVAPQSATEARLLAELGEAARSAGARMPGLLAAGQVGDTPVLVETVVAGRPLAELLGSSPGRFLEVAGSLLQWQERWNRATAAKHRLDASRLESLVLGPASELASELHDASAYRAWLAARCASPDVAGIPSVATHNDLTMWNVLLDERGSIGVLDWAEAERAGLPLTDFFYALADAAAACDRYRSRLEAVRSCFERGGARTPAVAALEQRLSAPLGLTTAATELCFHACWLRHALNEQRAGHATERPFLEIVRWQARRALEQA